MCKTKMMHLSEETAVSSSVVRQIENCEDDKRTRAFTFYTPNHLLFSSLQSPHL